MASYIHLTSIFEYIADAGYIAYNEESAQAEVPTRIAKAKENLLMQYKWQESRLNSRYKQLKAKALYRYLFPRLSAKD